MKDLFLIKKTVLSLFSVLKSDLELNNLLKKERGVSRVKKITESRMLGINALRIMANLNHIASIIFTNLKEIILINRIIIKIYSILVEFINRLINNNPKAIVEIVKYGLDLNFIRKEYI